MIRRVCLKAFLLCVFIGLLPGCYSNGPSSQNPDGGGAGGAAAIALTATPSTLTVNGTSTIQATVTTGGGANVPDGTLVSFSLNDTALGSVTPQATTANGIANAIFIAATTSGTVTITTSSGGVSKSVDVTITSPSTTGSIEFVSAVPTVIGVKGGGQTEISDITFLVRDLNGNPGADGTTVNFTMNGPSGGRLPENGGEYIGDLDTTPTTASALTVNGNATVILHSGTVAGSVAIIASVTVGSKTISSSSAPLSIGGGVASQTHFSLSRSVINLAGLAYDNEQSKITALLADRFGNFNVLKGTSVSFYTDSGAIDRNGITGDDGGVTVIFRTQNPLPADVPPDILGNILGFSEPFYTVGGHDYNPRDGWVTVIAVTQGEETFTDLNGNGVYDPGEPFVDAGQEPFIDSNDNGVYDPGEFFIDLNGDGQWTDGRNGKWDANTTIWTTTKLVFTGQPDIAAVTGHPTSRIVIADYSKDPSDPTKFLAPNGGCADFTIYISDINLNYITPGSTVEISATGGTLVGGGSIKIPDVLSTGPWIRNVSLCDDTTDLTVRSGSLTVNVTWLIQAVGSVEFEVGTVKGSVGVTP